MSRFLALLAVASVCLTGCVDAKATPSATSGPQTPAPTATAAGPNPGATSGATPGATEPAVALDVNGIAITLEPFAQVDGGPLAMAAANDGTGRLFVAAQDGRIWVVNADGSMLPDPMIDLASRLSSGGERGLLGLALHPTFPTDPRVFVDYTDTNGDTVVASIRLDPANPNRLDPASEQRILFVDQPYANHNGGALAFGPDGSLYVSLGDGGSGGDPHDNGQRLDTLLGKILRLDVDGTDTYEVPSDNPFVGGGGRPEIWLSGLRNPWRISFDRETGDLWIGDVGQGAWEEVDVARAGLGGLNFGWRLMEGSHCFRADSCDREHLTLPASDYGRDQGSTVIGGYVYRGATYGFLRGAYLFADYGSGSLFAIDATADEYATPTVVGSASNGISGWGEDVTGELYLLALDGTISRVAATQR
ncbi:MAG TPA: PQQ-dependent sugar dehydrogenase [Candidatus Limnocylindrales bacterium]|nr:PQQ-dependent sugar dehydrogenase [Candidatus Limnocylindrales bacterium]